MVRPSPRSHAKQPSFAKVAFILKPLLTCIDTSVKQYEGRQPDFDTSKWRGDGTPAKVTSPQPITNERIFLPQSSVSLVLLIGDTWTEESNKPDILFQLSVSSWKEKWWMMD